MTASVSGLATTATFSLTNAASAGPPTTVTIFGTTAPTAFFTDASVEVGVKFRSDVAGTVTGVRYYKNVTDNTTHTGSLWSSTGTLLATGTFTGGTASGWQVLTFATPVAINANTTYIASTHGTTYYATANALLNAGVDNAPLHALKNGVDGPNAVFAYGAGTVFPNQSFNSANYWADVVFVAASSPQTVVSVSGTPQSTTVGTTFATALQDEGHRRFIESPFRSVCNVYCAIDRSECDPKRCSVGDGDSNSSGIATSPIPVANSTAGAYSVTASVAGVATPATFSLTNTAGAPQSVAAFSGTPQSATTCGWTPTPRRPTSTAGRGRAVRGCRPPRSSPPPPPPAAINPQVMLVTLQKESGLLSRDRRHRRHLRRGLGLALPGHRPRRHRELRPGLRGVLQPGATGWPSSGRATGSIPGKYNYQAGQTVDILWNVAESGCGAAPVTIKNTATASLYNYTPYQPNAASLAAYPGTGDACSSYGNRNFFFLFRHYFGSTGGGLPGPGEPGVAPAGPAGAAPVSVTGTAVVIPASPFAVWRGRDYAGTVITAPTPGVAAGIAAGFGVLGTTYAWGGGNADGPTRGIRDGGTADSYGDYDKIGFDCSGLTTYVAARYPAAIPRLSDYQRSDAPRQVPWEQALPGDIVGYDGHVAVYLGVVDGQRMQLESPESGDQVRISGVRGDADPQAHRWWT